MDPVKERELEKDEECATADVRKNGKSLENCFISLISHHATEFERFEDFPRLRWLLLISFLQEI